MDEKQQIYRQKVWEFLDSIKPDEAYTVANLCKPENRELFIRSVKLYMDTHPWQGWLSFNKDYTKFYKIHPIIFKEERAIQSPLPDFVIQAGFAKGDEQPVPVS
jgi:hypothetical protein